MSVPIDVRIKTIEEEEEEITLMDLDLLFLPEQKYRLFLAHQQVFFFGRLFSAAVSIRDPFHVYEEEIERKMFMFYDRLFKEFFLTYSYPTSSLIFAFIFIFLFLRACLKLRLRKIEENFPSLPREPQQFLHENMKIPQHNFCIHSMSIQ
jgi:hypothetical protein